MTTPAPGSDPVFEALVEALRAAYGSRLSEEEFRYVCTRLAANRQLISAIRAYPLKNSDEPDFLFAARPEEV